MSRDTRTPTSVTRVGKKGIIRIYDEEAYRANIAQYYQGDESKPVDIHKKRRTSTPIPKRKARFNWAGKISS